MKCMIYAMSANARLGVTIVVCAVLGLLTGCLAREERVPAAARADTALVEEHSAENDATESVQPNIHPLTREEYAAMTEASTHTASDTAQPLKRAERRTAHFPKPAMPTVATGYPGPATRKEPPVELKNVMVANADTGWNLVPIAQAPRSTLASITTAPILDARERPCIGYPIPKSLSVARVNVLLQPNLEDATIRLWSIPAWRELMRIEGGTFPVNLWRVRQGVATFAEQVRVQAGPELPAGLPQPQLLATVFRGGDVLCIETVRHGGPLLIVVDAQTNLIVEPRVSIVENTSNDGTAMPGQWTTVSGVKP